MAAQVTASDDARQPPVVFLILPLVSAYIGENVIASGDEESGKPLFNQRAEHFVGRTATLDEPIN
jgi:membrane protein implicated in regulation of membrane protease activity